MKKFFLTTIIALSLFSFLLSPALVSAQQDRSKRDPLGVGYGQKTGLSNTDPRIIVGRIIQVGLGLLGIVAFVLIVYGGFMIMTAAGNEEKVETGKNVLLYAVIGLAIILSAYSITNYVISELYGATQGELYKP